MRRVSVAFVSVLAWAVGAAIASAAIVPDNYPTIQAAINAVKSGALPNGTLIEIRPGTYVEALQIVDTGKSMTLRAMNGPGTVTVSRAGVGGTVLTVIRTPGTIRFESLRFTGGVGTASTGGGMTLSEASPTFENCTFDGNTSALNGGAGLIDRGAPAFVRCTFSGNSAAQFGGALVMVNGTRPTFDGCTFQSNVSGTASTIGSGGAIHANDSSPTLRFCTVSGNQAKFAGGGIFHLGLFGSANGVATLRIEDSDISANTASRANAGSNPAEGGGINIEDNALGSILRSRIRNNVANTGGGLNAYRARYEVTSSIIEGNQAPDPAAVGGFGGGVQGSSNNPGGQPLRPAAAIVLSDTVVRNNTSRIGGGIFVGGDEICAGGACTDASATKATLSLTNSLVDGNTATKQAGGVFASRGSVAVSGGLVSRNRNNAGDGYGGGLSFVRGTAATLTAARIAANEAGQFGGGIFMDVGATLSLSGSSLYRNTAGNLGGALYVGSNGTNAGTVQSSALVDNTGTTIAEQCPTSAPYLSYLNNVIVASGTSTVYTGMCNPPGPLTVAQLNALPSGKASGNTGTLTLPTVQSLAYFASTPDVLPSVLAWSVIRATGVSISPSVSPAPSGDTGTVDVAGSSAASWSFTATSVLGGVGPIVASVTTPPPPPAGSLTLIAPNGGETFAAGSLQLVRWTGLVSGGAVIDIYYDAGGGRVFVTSRPSSDRSYVWTVPAGATSNARVTVESRLGGSVEAADTSDATFRVTAAAAPAPLLSDFNKDGKADLLWHHQGNGELYTWLLNGTTVASGSYFDPRAMTDTRWQIRGIADFSGDGKDDILWHHQGNGDLYVWILNGTSVTAGSYLNPSRMTDTRWQIRGIVDFDRDGDFDILWHHQGNGELYAWIMQGLAVQAGTYLDPRAFADTRWQIRGVADFTRDGQPDILWHHQLTGDLYVWVMQGTAVSWGSYLTPSSFADTRWQIRRVADFDGDGDVDILWHHQVTGELYVWKLDVLKTVDGAYFTPRFMNDVLWQIMPR